VEELGYQPVGFTSSAAALAAFCADPGRFDALIADEPMPGLFVASQTRAAGGDEVPKKPSGYLQQLGQFQFLPVVSRRSQLILARISGTQA
jgi:hypothetical protein